LHENSNRGSIPNAESIVILKKNSFLCLFLRGQVRGTHGTLKVRKDGRKTEKALSKGLQVEVT
jgi:hypothetical protein